MYRKQIQNFTVIDEKSNARNNFEKEKKTKMYQRANREKRYRKNCFMQHKRM